MSKYSRTKELMIRLIIVGLLQSKEEAFTWGSKVEGRGSLGD